MSDVDRHEPSAPDEHDELDFRVFNLRLDPHRLIYGTIILMTAFALYNGTDLPESFAVLPILTLTGVVVAPLFALTMAHAFSEALDMQIRTKRSLTGADRRHLIGQNLQYLYLAVPPVVIVVVLSLLNVHPSVVIGLVQALGLASLFFWGYYAGSKAELTRPRRFLMGLGYFVSGMIVIAVELALTH